MNSQVYIDSNHSHSYLSGNVFWTKLKNNKAALVAAGIILILIFISFFSDFLTAFSPEEQGDLLSSRYLSPSSSHPFGTDKFARDLFSRVLYGGRISLTIGFSVVILSLSIGVFYGIISGYLGKWIDSLMMRVIDFFLAFPVIFLIIAIVALFRPGFWYLILILGLTSWMDFARIIRAEVLSIKQSDYVKAARGFGFSHFRIMFRHILPNCLTPVLTAIPMKIGETILLESALSFLGVGVQPPTASWGNIINDGKAVMLDAWWISTIPGMFIVLTVICFNLLGEAIRKSMNG